MAGEMGYFNLSAILIPGFLFLHVAVPFRNAINFQDTKGRNHYQRQQ